MTLFLEKSKLTFSGHDSFPCRNLWLKKGFDYVLSGKSFSDEDSVVILGVGKNMVNAIRYWMKAFDLLDQDNKLTELAYFIFSDATGIDPYLEDDATLWILHYHLVKTGQASIYSLIFNYLRKERLEFSKTNFIQFVQREFGDQNENTLNTDFNVFSRMYVRNPAKSKDREDNLSELLNELNLVNSFKSENIEYYVIENLEREVRTNKDLDPNYKPNKKAIRNRLNKPNAFDKEIPFVENDVLNVVLNSDDYGNRKDFCFEYKNGVWIDSEYSSMWLKSRFDVYGYGKVEPKGKPSTGNTDINLIR